MPKLQSGGLYKTAEEIHPKLLMDYYLNGDQSERREAGNEIFRRLEALELEGSDLPETVTKPDAPDKICPLCKGKKGGWGWIVPDYHKPPRCKFTICRTCLGTGDLTQEEEARYRAHPGRASIHNLHQVKKWLNYWYLKCLVWRGFKI